MRLIEAASPEPANGAPAQPPPNTDVHRGEYEEDRHAGAGFIGIVQAEGRRHHEQAHETRSLEDGNHLFAQAAKTMNDVLAREMIRNDRSQEE